MNASIDNFVAKPTFDVVQQRMTQAYMGELISLIQLTEDKYD